MNHLICIFMNIHENLKKMRENHVKTMNRGGGGGGGGGGGEGLKYDLSCTPRAF